jgi:transcriptional regulator
VEEGGAFTLLGHVARANPAWRHLSARPRAAVTFLGPNAYMSPSVYPDLARVPTWNYLAVHCSVTARPLAHDDVAGKDRLLKALIGDHEPAYAQQWRDLGADFQHKMMEGIEAFELAVDGWQCKLKLNQHRQEAHAAMYAAYVAGSPEQRALAGWMQTLGLIPKE